MIRRAIISGDGVYRYRLSRRWAPRGQRAVWIMLNPSSADATVDDPTIRRCIDFSRSWGFAALDVVNLYALRTKCPADLRQHPDPVGPRSDHHIERAIEGSDVVIAAWGAFPWATPRARRFFLHLEYRVSCLGRTRSGQPRHPLYAPSGLLPQAFDLESALTPPNGSGRERSGRPTRSPS